LQDPRRCRPNPPKQKPVAEAPAPREDPPSFPEMLGPNGALVRWWWCRPWGKKGRCGKQKIMPQKSGQLLEPNKFVLGKLPYWQTSIDQHPCGNCVYLAPRPVSPPPKRERPPMREMLGNVFGGKGVCVQELCYVIFLDALNLNIRLDLQMIQKKNSRDT